MRRISHRALSLALAMCWLNSASAAPLNLPSRSASVQPTPEQYAQSHDPRLLALTAGIFDPKLETLSHPLATIRTPGTSKYAIVQFAVGSKPDPAWLIAQGVRVVGYVPNSAYLVEADARMRSQLGGDPRVRFVGAWREDYKIAEGVTAGDQDQVGLTVVLFRGEAPASLQSTVAALTGDAQPSLLDQGAWPSIRIGVPRARLASAVAALAALDEVQWIERFEYPHLHNANAVWPIQANQAVGANPIGNAPIWAQDIIGSGQIVAVADSGMDRNEAWFNRYNAGGGVNNVITDSEDTLPPAPGTTYPTRKVYGYFVMPGATGYDNNATCPGGTSTSFHGTHTSGTVAGDSGIASTPTEPNYNTGDGMAPNAQLLFQDLGNDISGCLAGVGGLPMFEQAKSVGAYISSNSYGSNYVSAPFYTSSDAEVDQALWLNDDMLIAFSAGNEGSGGTTIGHPAHSKHALTVGALGSGNSTTVAGYSSRGPTSDGRRKPDIMAPGTLVSASGNAENSNPPANPDQANVKTLSGTSMATPAVAGGAALARQYFTDGFYPSGVRTPANARKPLGTEMKALLTNGTAFIGNSPSNNYGWGRIWLDNNLYFPGDARDLRLFGRQQSTGLTTGEQHEYQVQVAAGQEFRATLAWYDPPGTPGAAGTALVNNLDLEVSDGVNTYRGNVFTGSGATGNSTTGGSADLLNPLEQVRFTAPTAGLYTIRVKGTAVPGDGQAYANRQGYGLAVSSGQCATAVNAAPSSISAQNVVSGIQVSAATVAGASGYQLYRATGTCAGAATADFQLVAHGNGSAVTDSLTQGGYSYAYKVRAVDACGEGPISSCTEITSTAICSLFPTFDQSSVTTAAATPGSCDVRVQWTGGASNCPAAPTLRYNVYRSTDPLFTPAPANRIATAVTGTEFVDQSALSLTTYYYVVRAEDSTTGNIGPSGGNESLGIARTKHTPSSAVNVVGTFSDGADSPSFMALSAPWTISNDRAAVGTYSYRSAPDGANTYAPDTCGAITTPPIQLQNGTSVLTFKARYDIETNWDGVVMEVSTDGGPFVPLAPDTGYPSSFSQTGSPPINACGFAASQGAFSGSTANAFQTFTRTFNGAGVRTVQVRWRFSSDPGSEEEGFYLDDVQITNASTPGMCSNDSLFQNGFE